MDDPKEGKGRAGSSRLSTDNSGLDVGQASAPHTPRALSPAKEKAATNDPDDSDDGADDDRNKDDMSKRKAAEDKPAEEKGAKKDKVAKKDKAAEVKAAEVKAAKGKADKDEADKDKAAKDKADKDTAHRMKVTLPLQSTADENNRVIQPKSPGPVSRSSTKKSLPEARKPFNKGI
jgi:hypothetical protein